MKTAVKTDSTPVHESSGACENATPEHLPKLVVYHSRMAACAALAKKPERVMW